MKLLYKMISTFKKKTLNAYTYSNSSASAKSKAQLSNSSNTLSRSLNYTRFQYEHFKSTEPLQSTDAAVVNPY